ncbi:BCCT family transporter [Thiococcus pfennigii]|jgi:choline/glycine/proline betaine transport protein|uniref:BCCT family transporter n=1 Tax=Thiococcus pfennigii TaxID=1057 RepID=UPI001907C620|nr:BCCT family transporter [Thiococcus pfennigii]MBK1700805.1 choline transporter [Thiococcus pfennigii]MBK1731929.1 choline transporter [Thiococcus pfennigii]
MRVKNWTYVLKGTRLLDLNPVVFVTSAVVILGFVAASFIWLDAMAEFFNAAQAWIANTTGWFFVLAINAILIYVIYLGFSRFGKIRLGGEDAKPEFTLLGWFSMLFSAGMGIGLLFYAVAEPMYHLVTPPHGAEPHSLMAYKDAMRTTFLHWGLHPWGVYALVGVALAFFAFNLKQPLSIRSIFYPLLGDRIYGFWGHLVDIVATVATLFGVATSLGLGVSQINGGLNHIFDLPESSTIQVALIAAITGIATISVVAGLNHGIRRLSEANMLGAAILLLFVLVVGPTLFILNGFVENLGLYLNDFFYLALWNETYSAGDWQNAWTVFYWGWWIAWSPFVGMFIARVSRGRTIRQFVAGVLLVPTLLTFLWLSIFGDAAMYFELFEEGGIAAAAQENLTTSLFVFLDRLPGASFAGSIVTVLASTAGVLATLIIITFFVTSSDSGSLVIDMITAGGKTEPPVAQRVFWAVTEGAVAAALLVAGGLSALQTAAIATGLPFAALLLLLIWSLHRGLSGARASGA